MADQVDKDSLLQGLGLWYSACAAFLSSLLIMMFVKGSEDMASHPHSCQHVTAGLCECLHRCPISIPYLPPGISLVANRLCRIWPYGEQIHLVLDTCSLLYINTLNTREIPPPLTKHCCFSSWEGN